MATETSPAFQFYVKEWRSSRPVMRMTFAQRGMYLEMLLEQWENLSLPDSPDECAELIGGTVEEWRANWEVLRRKFLRDDVTGRITNTRMEQVRKERRRFEKWSKTNARKGGLARAASATRGQNGTYHPAESPAEQPAETASDSQPTASLRPPANPATASASASASATAYTARPRPATIFQKRRGDATWEGPRGLYIHRTQHAQFVELRGGDESALLEWYAVVGEEWSVGARKSDEPGADMFKFWTARYAERWPATPAAPKDTGPVYTKAHEHRYAQRPTGTAS